MNGCAFGGGLRWGGTGGAVTTGDFGVFTFFPTASAPGGCNGSATYGTLVYTWTDGASSGSDFLAKNSMTFLGR